MGRDWHRQYKQGRWNVRRLLGRSSRAHRTALRPSVPMLFMRRANAADSQCCNVPRLSHPSYQHHARLLLACEAETKNPRRRDHSSHALDAGPALHSVWTLVKLLDVDLITACTPT